ncbi:MAG TPA: phosphoesterase [Ktedonobacteraceae bacterium]|nr:phosphoesterase [Ktedonobacteraceae bacterium]
MVDKMRKDLSFDIQPVDGRENTDLPSKHLLSRRTVLQTGAGVLVAVMGAGAFLHLHQSPIIAATPPSPPQRIPNAVIQWNNAALDAIRATNPGPTIGSRALAIMHTCMYDAWATYDPVAVPTRPNGIPRQRPQQDVTQAVSYAAYRAMMDLFPSQAAQFNALMQSLGFDPNNNSTDTTAQAGVGNVAAQAVISFRHADGSNQLNDYADTSGYVPVNTPTQLNDPTRWQPLLVNGKVQQYLTPHWGTITPFALTSGSQFRPAGPVMDPTSSAYKSQANQIIQLSASLDDTTKTIADYWANGPHSETPPGHWLLFTQFFAAQFLSQKNRHGLNSDITLFFMVANAVFDAGIACWECKRFYNSVRPITAVRYLYTGSQINAWGGIGKGTVSMDGGQWQPYQEANVVTPSFPEYVSGHSTFSAAGAYILQLQSPGGNGTFGDSFTAQPGSSQIEPGFAPTQSVTLSWPTFSSAADQAGLSRRYGGIHFEQGDLDGRALGKQVGAQVAAKAQAYIAGKITPGS